MTLTLTTTAYPIVKILMPTTTVFHIVTFRFSPRTTISACPRLVLALWQVQWTIFNSRKYGPSYYDSRDCLLTRIWNQMSHYSHLNILAHVR